MIGLSVGDTTLGTTIANLGMTDVSFPAPVFVGDTIRARTTVAEARGSKSRADAGIVTFEHQAFNQKDQLVASCQRAALMLRAQSGSASCGERVCTCVSDSVVAVSFKKQQLI